MSQIEAKLQAMGLVLPEPLKVPAGLQESAHFDITRTFLTPGDISTEQVTVTGLFSKVVLPEGGIILLDAGKIVNDPNGDIIFEASQHQFTHSQLTEVCAALS